MTPANRESPTAPPMNHPPTTPPVIASRTATALHRVPSPRTSALAFAFSFSLSVCLLLFLFLVPSAFAQEPLWIWGDPATPATAENPSTRWFRKSFRTPPYTWNARLTVAADDSATVYLNGREVVACSQPGQPARAEVSMNLNQGENLLAVRVDNRSGPAGLLVHLHLGGAESREVLSDRSWIVTDREQPRWNQRESDTASWAPARELGPHGIPPWGETLLKASATPASSLELLPGFTAELLRSAQPEEGSWICLTFDPRGRLYVSPEGDAKPLLRFTFDPTGSIARVDPVPAPIHFAMGLLHAHGSLYANAKGPSGTGLYRLTDTNANDRFDPEEVRLLKTFKGGGEHGYHALALGPDQRLYVLNGNVTKPPDGLSPASPMRHYGEDVLSLNPDETTRAGGALAPGCQILRTDPEGQHWELFAAGMRNAYDLDFNPDGELFTFDSDNEWDWGTPWYRPTRIYHCVSGAEMGWRDGTRAWADSYPDMIGSVLDIGIGSPCGVKFGTHARFPDTYRRALFVQDWSYGRILAVHLQPHGATYRGTFEEFVKGQPLNLTSMAFGPDGALYFVTGGRGTQSGLYRVRFTGDLPAAPVAIAADPSSTPQDHAARSLRHRLETFHGHATPGAVEELWPHLGSPDRALRYAARVALESQPLEHWLDRALSETNATVALHALLALARIGPPETQPRLFRTLTRFPLLALDEDHRLLKLRTLQLSFLRQGLPQGEWIERAIAKLSPLYPAPTWAENRELVRLLTVLGAPGVVARTLDLLEHAHTAEQRLHYLAQLRNLRTDWTPELRRRFFAAWIQPRDHLQPPGSLLHWFQDVGRPYVDGAGLDRHLESFRRGAIAAVPESEQPALRDLFESPLPGAQLVPPTPREFVRHWTLAELLPHLDQAGSGRNFDRGRRAFIDTQCYACHRLGNVGGAVGPELGAVLGKYTRRDLLESMIEPSKVISEQFQNVRVFRKDGEDVTGRRVRETEHEIVLETDPLTRTEQTIPMSEIDEIKPSTVSPMPEGLLQILTRDDILDLLAFLESAGRPDAPAFRQP